MTKKFSTSLCRRDHGLQQSRRDHRYNKRCGQIATSGVWLASTGTFRTHNSPMTLVQKGKVYFVNDEVINVKANPLSATASSNRKHLKECHKICFCHVVPYSPLIRRW